VSRQSYQMLLWSHCSSLRGRSQYCRMLQRYVTLFRGLMCTYRVVLWSVSCKCRH